MSTLIKKKLVAWNAYQEIMEARKREIFLAGLYTGIRLARETQSGHHRPVRLTDRHSAILAVEAGITDPDALARVYLKDLQ